MYTYDECLEALRKKLPKAVIISSVEMKNGMYSFCVAKHGKIVKGDLTRSSFAVDPKTGDIQEYDIGDIIDLHMKDPEKSEGYRELEDTLRWIDADPEII